MAKSSPARTTLLHFILFLIAGTSTLRRHYRNTLVLGRVRAPKGTSLDGGSGDTG
jgi:hypothetical protein